VYTHAHKGERKRGKEGARRREERKTHPDRG